MPTVLISRLAKYRTVFFAVIVFSLKNVVTVFLGFPPGVRGIVAGFALNHGRSSLYAHAIKMFHVFLCCMEYLHIYAIHGIIHLFWLPRFSFQYQ